MAEHAPGNSDIPFEAHGVRAMRGERSAHRHRFGIVVSTFNSDITEKLFTSAVTTLQDAGASERAIEAVQVPGAMEIPLAARQLAIADKYAAILALGCVIRGDTPHFDFVCRTVTDGCWRVSLDSGIPVTFGVVTVDTPEQARDRAHLDGGRNLGHEAAIAALEMVDLLHKLD